MVSPLFWLLPVWWVNDKWRALYKDLMHQEDNGFTMCQRLHSQFVTRKLARNTNRPCLLKNKSGALSRKVTILIFKEGGGGGRGVDLWFLTADLSHKACLLFRHVKDTSCRCLWSIHLLIDSYLKAFKKKLNCEYVICPLLWPCI